MEGEIKSGTKVIDDLYFESLTPNDKQDIKQMLEENGYHRIQGTDGNYYWVRN